LVQFPVLENIVKKNLKLSFRELLTHQNLHAKVLLSCMTSHIPAKWCCIFTNRHQAITYCHVQVCALVSTRKCCKVSAPARWYRFSVVYHQSHSRCAGSKI